MATTLTQSLLNQPFPLPVASAARALPCNEVKSRKENRASSKAPLGNASEHGEARRASQAALGSLGKGFRSGSTPKSPASRSTFSGVFSQRSHSGSGFGLDITNSQPADSNHDVQMADNNHTNADHRMYASGSEKRNKRTHNFTPVSSKVIDVEDEPRQHSPGVRIGSNSKKN